MTTKKKVIRRRKLKFNINTTKGFLVFLLIISTIIGLITMGMWFTLLLDLGIAFIVLISHLVNKLKKSKKTRILVNILAIFFLLLCIGGTGGVIWFLNYVVDHAPEFTSEKLVMTQTSKVYDINNKEYAELGTEKREIITYDQMNEVIIDALVATEDSRFFQHNGFDAPRFLLASLKQAGGNEKAGGASTLTMQVAKNSYTDATLVGGFEGIVRKFTDIYLAVFKIEKQYSKQEVIEFYLNDHFLGSNSYGIEQASQTYFGKKASELNLAEATLLIGMYKAPSAFNPFNNPSAAAIRRKEVLDLMERHGYITAEENAIADSIPVESLLAEMSDSSKRYAAYINTVVEEAIDKYKINPNTTSVLVYTNMDPKKQSSLDDIFNGKTYKWENDVVQAGVAAIDVNTGKIIAIGAGRNRDDARTFNYATSTKRQIGSTAKPLFDYAPGIEYNNWSTYSLFDDSKYYYSSGQEIRNSDRKYMGIITMRTALAQSRNIPALKAFQQVENKKIYDFVTSLGISLEKDSIKNEYLHEAYSIGSFNGSNPLQMAAAYATFANGGYYYEPYTITKIILRDTGEVITHESEKVKVMSDSTAFMITDMLKTAVNSGLSGVAKVNGVNVAAKTGTTNYTEAILKANGLPNSAINDAWVIGYDPSVAIGLWYGYEPLSKKYYTTADSAYTQRKRLFSAIGNAIFKKNGADFKEPSSVVKVGIEMGTNPAKLAGPNTPKDKIVYEYFKKGTEPTEVSTAYSSLNNAKDLKVSYEPSTLTVSISWQKAAPPDDILTTYGDMGYKVYKDGTYLGFTKENNFTLKNVSDPAGVYKVITGYQKSNANNSSGISYNFSYEIEKPPTYNAALVVPQASTYKVNDVLQAYDANPGTADVKVTKNTEDITAQCSITISITDSTGNLVTSIVTTQVNTYTITYKISYPNYETTLTRTIIVKDAI